MGIDTMTGKRASTKYRISANFSKFIILPCKGASTAEIICLVANIKDVYTFEDGESCFPKFASGLTNAERDLLVRMMYSDEQGNSCDICFLVDSQSHRDMLLKSLEILCIYSHPLKN